MLGPCSAGAAGMAVPGDSCSIGSLYAIKKQLVLGLVSSAGGYLRGPLAAPPGRNACDELGWEFRVVNADLVLLERGQGMKCKCWGLFLGWEDGKGRDG